MATNDVPLQYDDGTRHQQLDLFSYTSSTLSLKAGKHLALSATSNFGVFGATPVGKSTDALYSAISTPGVGYVQAEATAVVNTLNKLVADLKLLGFIASP